MHNQHLDEVEHMGLTVGHDTGPRGQLEASTPRSTPYLRTSKRTRVGGVAMPGRLYTGAAQATRPQPSSEANEARQIQDEPVCRHHSFRLR